MMATQAAQSLFGVVKDLMYPAILEHKPGAQFQAPTILGEQCGGLYMKITA